jgi:hypothetical protein
MGDKVWLHLQKECLTGPHQKLRPLLYGPYITTKVVGGNAFELNTPPFLGLHPVFNVDLLRPYFPPLLDTSEIVEQLTPKKLNPDCMEQASITHRSRTLPSRGSNDPGGYWWPPTYSNWLLLTVFSSTRSSVILCNYGFYTSGVV